MAESIADPLAWFPYDPRPQQDRAVILAANTYDEGTVGMLSADCGVGKTIASLSGYFAARGAEPDSRLFVLTRTHSQSKVFEEELEVLQGRTQESDIPLTATSMVSRIHVCPNKSRIDTETSTGFMRGCAKLIRSGRCTYYWNFYKRQKDDGTPIIREHTRELVQTLLSEGVVNREKSENLGHIEDICPYEILRWSARKSRVIIGPYSYLFKERIRDALLASLGQHLDESDLLIDEAHNLPEHVLSSESATLNGDDLQWLRESKSSVQKEVSVSWIGDVIEFLWDTLMVALDSLSRKRNEIVLNKWQILPRFVEPDLIRILMESTHLSNQDDSVPSETPVDRLIEFLYTALRSRQSDDWHITAELTPRGTREIRITDGKLIIRPLNAAGLIAPVLRGSRAALLMSGTLRPISLYSGLMGIKGAKSEDLGSPYPKSSRLVLLDQEITTKYTARGPKLWRAIASRIETALTSTPAEKTALIAFSSYDVMQQVLSYNIDCGFRERIVEDREARIEYLKDAVQGGPKAVFLVYGGKFSEGVDLVENGRSLVDLIVGVGIPFSPPTSYQKSLQNWYENRFGKGAGYYYSSVIPSVRKVVQLVGRLRRSPEDWGIVVLLDHRFERFVSMFGEDIVSDLWPYKGLDELKEAIASFLELRGVR